MIRRVGWIYRAGAVVLAAAWVGPTAAVAQGAEPVSLEDALHEALANSRDIAVAEQGLRIARQRVREAWASVFPDVQASASYQRNLKVQEAFLPAFIFDPSAPPDEVVPVRFGSDNTWTAGLTFNQPLFEYNAFIGVGAAGRFETLESERLRGTTQDVVTAVREAYLGALLAEEELRLTENSLTRVRQTLEETRALNRAGLASDYDVLRLEVEVANLEPNLRRVQNAVRARVRDLLIEMGRSPTDDIVLEGSLSTMSLEDFSGNEAANANLIAMTGLPVEADLQLEELLQLAMQRRSDLRQIRLTISLENSRLASQKADYYPKLSLFSNYNITAQENGSPTFFGTPNTRTVSAVTGFSISVPIFQGFSRDARVQQTRSTVWQNEAQLERAEFRTESDLRTQLDNLEETRLRVTSQARAVEQAERGFEIASAEYRAGTSSQLQVTDAELALRQSAFNYARAVFEYLLARTRLDTTIGTVPTLAGELAARGQTREDER